MPTLNRDPSSTAPSAASRTPEKAVTLTIPESCRMRGVYNGNRDIQITFGKHADGVKIRFDRIALEQLARLAHELLAVPYADEPPKLPVRIQKPGPPHVPDITGGEDSAFVAGLRYVGERLEPYVRWLLDPDAPDTRPFDFADEFVLSMVIDTLAHGIRELAYDRHDVDNLGRGS